MDISFWNYYSIYYRASKKKGQIIYKGQNIKERQISHSNIQCKSITGQSSYETKGQKVQVSHFVSSQAVLQV
jgi:hypothetical protein